MDTTLNRHSIDLTSATVVAPLDLDGRGRQAVTMLIEEVEKRSRVRWTVADSWPATPGPVISIGRISALPSANGPRTCEPAAEGAPEGYHIWIENDEQVSGIYVCGNDARGILFGIGHLLRVLVMQPEAITLDADLNVATAPYYRLRGHQLGYRDKTNSYCGWDLDQWEQYIRDLVVFGANAIELIPPRSDDLPDSVHFPRPPLEMMAGMSRLADDYGVDVWIWYPAMDDDYGDPNTVEAALQEWREVFEALPRIDAVFVPGGDPGHSHPRDLMPMLAKQAASLRELHPTAEMWISPQGFTHEWMYELLAILRDEQPDWLDGVVHGPWIFVPIDEFRELIPSQYALRNYPDITHTLNCQYPVADWDLAFALTEGREPINPRPRAQRAIFHATQDPTIGFLTYCEGCHDDVNKCVWSALGWDPEADVVQVLREYSRYFIGAKYADDFAQGLLALERNWEGSLAINAGVYTTLQQFQTMEAAASPRDLKNWRFQQALYRAYYDAYVRSRLLYETGLEEQAMDQLRDAKNTNSLTALSEAERILNRALTEPISRGWRTRLFQLAEALFQSIHMQLSVPLYRGQREVRGANLDGADFPLNNGPWLKERFAELRALDTAEERLAGIQELLDWTNPGPGGIYADLSSPSQQACLVRGPGYAEDPGFLRSPYRLYSYRKDPTPQRISWHCYTGSLNDAPFEMHFDNLDPEAQYHVRIVYSPENPQIMVRLEANDGIEVHPFMGKAVPREPLQYAIPREATRDNELTLRWWREQGGGGAGRGCEISEIWLIKE